MRERKLVKTGEERKDSAIFWYTKGRERSGGQRGKLQEGGT